MTSRERVLMTLGHREPDRVPYDLASTQVTGISLGAYAALRRHLNMPPAEPRVCDSIQQICIPHDDMMERLGVDTRGLFPLCSANWNVRNEDAGEYWSYTDEWGLSHRMPKEGGHWYSLYRSPLSEGALTEEAIARHSWPDPADPRRTAGLREQALRAREAGKAVVMKGLCAGVFEMACRLRGMENFLMDLLEDEAGAVALMRKVMELKARFWQAALEELGGAVDVAAEADDFGTQESMLVRPALFRRLIKPLEAELIAVIRKGMPGGFVFFHSCGSVRELIPDFIEIGIDALNPVHVAAAGMEPGGLKRDFGKDICFWGGGVETQRVLPRGTPEQVRESVRRNVEALAPGGGYVFNTVHNIQPEAPPRNIMAMLDALREFGAYR